MREDDEAATEHPARSAEEAEAEGARGRNAELPMSILEAFLGSAKDAAAEDVLLQALGTFTTGHLKQSFN